MSRKPLPINPIDAVTEYSAGLTLRQIADLYNCSHTTIRHRLIDSGIYIPICHAADTITRTAVAIERYKTKDAAYMHLLATIERKKRKVKNQRSAPAHSTSCRNSS